MIKRVKNFYNIIAVCTLYVLGNTIINAPFENADKYTFLALMLIGATGVLVCTVLLPFLAKALAFLKENKSLVAKSVLALFYIAIGVFSLFCAANTFEVLLRFVLKVMLPEGSKYIVCGILFFGVLYFALQTKQTLLKFALLWGVVGIIVIILFFIGLFENYNFKNIFIYNLPSYKTLLKQAGSYLKVGILELLPLVAFLGFKYKKSHLKAAFWGVLLGFVMLLLCIGGSILLFGPNLAGELEFAYSQFISTFTVGRLFTRLDALSYLLFFITSVTKIWVLAQVVKETLKETNQLLLLFNRS